MSAHTDHASGWSTEIDGIRISPLVHVLILADSNVSCGRLTSLRLKQSNTTFQDA